MLYFLIPLPLIPLVFIAILAFSKKSDPMVKKIAIIALILIVVSIIICGILLVKASSDEVSVANIPVIVETQEVKTTDFRFLILFVIILAGIVGLLLFLLSREKKALKTRKSLKK